MRSFITCTLRQVQFEEVKRNAYRILVGNPEGKRPLRRPRRRWVCNIKMDLRDIGWDGIGNKPLGSIKCLEV
jgi:hypothetical protein